MKRVLLITAVIFCSMLSFAYAEEIDEDSPDSEYVSMEVNVGLQSVFTNEIPLIVSFTPNTDSNKASIEWVLPYDLESDSDLKQWFPVEKGTEYEVKVWVSPEEPGRYEVPINVDVWLYNSSHINTRTLSFEVDDSLRVSPVPSEYVRNFVLKWVAMVILCVVVIFVLWRLWVIFFPKFKKWLEE